MVLNVLLLYFFFSVYNSPPFVFFFLSISFSTRQAFLTHVGSQNFYNDAFSGAATDREGSALKL